MSTDAPRGTATTASAMEPQRVDAPLTASAVFLVVELAPPTPDADGADDANDAAAAAVRATLAGVDGLVKTVGFRDLAGQLTCTVGIGSGAWDRLVDGALAPRPAELHAFRAVRGPKHAAVSTAGDVLFHIRAERRDLCFELERQLLDALGGAVRVVDETVGFRYFENRDLLGFVDGTANPVGAAVRASTLVTAAEDAAALAGGSYVVVQKYVHDLAAWRALRAEEQEAVIGRTKLDNAELDDATGAHSQRSHKTLTTVEDDDSGGGGGELAIVRDNMPFGSPGRGEFGTYFIGYTRRLWVLEKMLHNMFAGDPPGLHDRLLDFSRPLTGTVFFAPPASLLARLG